MGYRSDVMAVFYATPDKAAALKLYVTENFPEDLAGHLKPIDNGHYMGFMFEGDGWKWYPSYPDVQEFNRCVSNFLELVDGGDDGPSWCYEFARIGEDYDDMEVNRSDDSAFVLNFARSIEVDF